MTEPRAEIRTPGPLVEVYFEVEGTGASYRQLERLGTTINRLPTIDSGRVVLAQDCVVAIGAGVAGRRIDFETLKGAPNLRLIANYTIGCDNIDMAAASEMGVLVANNPRESNWGNVAETTVAYMLAFLKRIRERDLEVRAGRWDSDDRLLGQYVGARREDGYPGLTIGLVGLGRTGRRVVELLAPWRARVIAVDPIVDDEVFRQLRVERATLEDLLIRSDVVSLHCELGATTRGLLGARLIGLMKPAAFLVNSARAGVVDTAALVEALARGRIAGAALDVCDDEPLPAFHDLCALTGRTFLSPHMFGMSEGVSLGASAPLLEARVLAALRGEAPEDVVNAGAIERWRRRFGGRSTFRNTIEQAPNGRDQLANSSSR